MKMHNCAYHCITPAYINSDFCKNGAFADKAEPISNADLKQSERRTGRMKNVVLTRIDERLIHGQVATSWLKIRSDPNYILIVDDKLVNDAMQKRLLYIVAEQFNVAVDIKSVDDAAQWLAQDAEPGQNIIVMTKVPGPLLALIKKGIRLPEIILGNMGMAAGRKRFSRNISASDEEIQQFKDILSSGTEIYCQMVPTESKKSIDSLL